MTLDQETLERLGPQTVSALIARVREAEARVAELEAGETK